MGGRLFLLGVVTSGLVACSPQETALTPDIPPPLPEEEAVEDITDEALTTPQARPDMDDEEAGEDEASTPAEPSEASTNLARQYSALAARQQSRGLLRRDRTPSDAPVTPYLLARNFEAIALSTEHGLAAGGQATMGSDTPLARWTRAIQVELITGASVSAATRQAARGEVASTVAQLSRASGHRMAMVNSGGNFQILLLSEDDRRALDLDSLSDVLPGVPFSVLRVLLRPDPNARCLVVGMGNITQPNSFSAAVALIRAELPAVMRYACIQEELAQGMGLPNDSAAARPSIFNDNDEFAVLTQHDEWLLQMLYDDRLRPGMTAEQARPTIQTIASELVDGTADTTTLAAAFAWR